MMMTTIRLLVLAEKECRGSSAVLTNTSTRWMTAAFIVVTSVDRACRRTSVETIVLVSYRIKLEENFALHLYWRNCIPLYRVNLKSSPLDIFADFSKMGLNFNIKLYTFIKSIHLRFCAE